MVDASLERLQAASQERFGLDFHGGLRTATGLNLDANGISHFYFGTDINQNIDGLLALLSGGVLLNGTANSYVETADKVALDIAGDIDMRCEFSLAFGNPLTAQTLIGKWTPTTQQSYQMTIIPVFATTQLVTSSTGANSVTNQLANLPVGQAMTLRVTLDADNGAAGRTARFYTAPSLDGPFTESSGSPVTTAGVTTLFNSTAVLRLGALGNGTQALVGRINRAEVRNGIDGTVVANPDLRDVEPGATSFVDAAGNTWNVGSAARVA